MGRKKAITAESKDSQTSPFKKPATSAQTKKDQDRTVRAKARFISCFAKNKGIVGKAAISAGISRRQVITWRKEDPAFADLYNEAETQSVEFVESEMMKQIKRGNTTLTLFYLVNRSHGRWENIQKVEQKADDSTTAKIDRILADTTKLLGLDK